MSDADEQRKRRRAHTLASIGQRDEMATMTPMEKRATRSLAAMLAEVEDNLCRKIGAKKP